MKLNKVFGFICLITSPTLAIPAPLADDVLANFLRDVSNKESVVVKRRIFEDNGDRELKQISLSSLVGDLESNIVASALSLNKVFTDKNFSVPEIKPEDDSKHEQNVNNKHQSLKTEVDDYLPVTNKVILQTTEKVPEAYGEPTHILIDRIAIQPHSGGVALIPIFEIKPTGKDEDANKDHEITKTEISLASVTPDSSSIPSTTNFPTLNSTTATSITTIKTTPKNIETLKEAEEELKEKFAEIEAEPIILSARV